MLPICVIEDGAPIRKLIEVLLRKAGYEVVSFEQGRHAIEWLRENPVQAVLCDLILPDLNGVEVLRFVRSLPAGESIPVIAVTGLAEERDRNLYLSAGFDAYITKPISTATFAETVRQCIHEKERTRRTERVG
jgi:CheY-like chemotaxis protein